MKKFYVMIEKLATVSQQLTYGHYVELLLLTDINKISFAYYIIDLVKQVVKHEYNENIYNILISSILKSLSS